MAVTAPKYRFGPLVLALGLPLFGAGLSESGPAAGLEFALLILAGSVYAWLVSLIWPDRPGSPRTAAPAVGTARLLDYGVRLGLTGALTLSIGYGLGLDHPGWACTAALLVSRPAPGATRQRVLGRALAVLTGGTASVLVSALHPSSLVLALCTVVAITGMTATNGSRWYISGGFSTFLVLLLLQLNEPGAGDWWYVERIGATLIGVVTAYLLMSVLPAWRSGRAARA